jgi:hypothetical protein
VGARYSTGHAAGCRAAKAARLRRRIGAVAMVGGGIALVGSGAFSSWAVSDSASSGTLTAASASVSLLDANGGSFAAAIGNLLPSDYFYRYVDVRNSGSQAGTYVGTVDSSGDLAGQVAVDASTCSVPWTTVAGISTCTGTTTSLGSGTPTAGNPLTINHGTIAVGSGAAQHVRYRFSFSALAPLALQGKTGAVAVGVTNTLVGGADRTNG